MTFKGEKYSFPLDLIWNIFYLSFFTTFCNSMHKKNAHTTAWSQGIPIDQATPVYKQSNWTKLSRTRVIALAYYLMEYFEWNTQKQWVN